MTNSITSLSLKDTGRIYLDHNATTAPALGIVQRLPEWIAAWGNPSSIHMTGRRPKLLLREARDSVAHLVHARPLEIVFTSGGSEANNTVIKGICKSEKAAGNHRNVIVTTRIEHPSVAEVIQELANDGFEIRYLDVSSKGEISTIQAEEILQDDVLLMSVMAANNETGTILPIEKLTTMAHKKGILVHTDAVQTLGKIVVDVKKWGVDFATFSGHKFYSMKGCGVIYSNTGKHFESLIHGGGQERGRRAGTENILAITSLGWVAKNHKNLVKEKFQNMLAMRDELEKTILANVDHVFITGAAEKRLPNTSSLVIDDVDGESLLMNLDIAGISVSTGAACSSGSPEPSPTLLAMGLTRRQAQNSLRVSIGWDTTSEELAQFVVILKQTVERLRKLKLDAVNLRGIEL
jgi:cysteine desulfurase